VAIDVLFLQATGGDTPISISAQQIRTLTDALVTGTGVSWQSDLAVSQRAAGANFSVDVAAGHAIIAGTSVADQGKYVFQNTATINVPVTGAPGSGTRHDLIYAQVRDKQADGGSAYDGVIASLTGTVGAGLPATPANAIPLAQIGPIISSTPSITTSLITDLRARARTADDPLYVLSVTESATHSATSTTRVNVIPTQTFRVAGASADRYLFTVFGPTLTGTTGGELGRLILNVDSTEVVRCQWKSDAAGGAGDVSSSIPEFPMALAAGSHTVKVDLIRVTGGSEVNTSGTVLLVKKARGT
jgi:hypothetical protein